MNIRNNIMAIHTKNLSLTAGRSPLHILVSIVMVCAATALCAQESVTLSTGWTFRQERLRNWHPATVPGTVHTDLMAIGSIEDPFLGMNERAVQWIDKEDWLYDNHFEVTEAQQQRSRRELTFYGLDTYADVWLNDSLILKADNMFRTWRVDVTHLTHVGSNHLRVRLCSPVRMDLPKWQQFPNQHFASSDQSQNGGLLDCQLSPFIRKAPYHYGWDWGPRLVVMGIWRPVVFTAWDAAVIRDVFVEQQEVTRRRAVIRHHVTIEADHDCAATITVTDSATQRPLATHKVALHRGQNDVTLPYTIANPRLWWTNGLGEPHLYTLQTRVKTEGNTATSRTTKVGLRSVRLHRVPDADGEAFFFTLNGEKVFMKGANYIPCDVFLPRVTDSVYRRTIADAVAVNMNMLRVWGGGVYEDDRFYDLCDAAGILVWQDFMFACSMYPASGDFLQNIRQEAIDNVRRLRNHPCIALWCGNNEVQDAWFSWGWKQRSEQRGDGQAERLWDEYKELFFKTLPEVVSEYAPQTDYQPSSPFATPVGRSQLTRGDYHYWEVWHGRKPISEYNNVRARFFSEYGMQSFPELASVQRFCPDAKDWSITSDVMMAHQRGGTHANELIESYLNTEYGRPIGFDSLLYVGQLMQGDAMKTAIEAHRRDKGYCWGSLLWQINDCWPVASWSTRDYYGRWKAAHYMVRQAMADILVSPIQQADSTLHVIIVNDRLAPVNGQLTVEVWRTRGEVESLKLKVKSEAFKAKSLKIKVKVGANSVGDVWSMPTAQLLTQAGIAADEAVIHVELYVQGTQYANNYILVYPKHLKLQPANLRWTIEDSQVADSKFQVSGFRSQASGYDITLTSDRYARGIFLSIDGDDTHHFSDNYFDLLPGQTRTVSVASTLTRDEVQRRLRVMAYGQGNNAVGPDDKDSHQRSFAQQIALPAVSTRVTRRPAESERLFRSNAVERKIEEVKRQLAHAPYLAWMFENCFPNTLDTTVHYATTEDGDDDTFVYTGDIHAMWLRDSSAQVWPYVQFARDDEDIRHMVRGTILRQLKLICIDPYANAFNMGPTGSDWASDLTDMNPWLHERKYEIDSLCYPLRLAYEYWRVTGDDSIFRTDLWHEAMTAILRTFREQQRKDSHGPYRFQRRTAAQYDTMSHNGYGNPVRPCGLIASAFRPSDDCTVLLYLIPSNFMAVSSLRKAAELLRLPSVGGQEGALADECTSLADEVEAALREYAVYTHPKYGPIYAFEVDGFGNQLLMDDANVPSLLAMAYLGDVPADDPVYRNTRRFVLSDDNPYFFRGKAGEGIGGPHVGYDMVWPMSIMMRAFTSSDDNEIRHCLQMLVDTDADTGFIHESFHKDDAKRYTRSWFAWQNTLFGELILKLLADGKLDLLNTIQKGE